MEVALEVDKDSPSGWRGSKLAAKGSVVAVPFVEVGEPLKKVPPHPRGRGGGVPKSQANRDSRGGSYFLVRGEIL